MKKLKGEWNQECYDMGRRNGFKEANDLCDKLAEALQFMVDGAIEAQWHEPKNINKHVYDKAKGILALYNARKGKG